MSESGLYCRIITEGLLGFRPTGFRSFSLTPQMPTEWNEYSLCNIFACTDTPINIFVQRTGKGKLTVRIEKDLKTIKTYTISPGQTIKVSVK